MEIAKISLEEVKNKVHNIELVVEEIKKFPQTYDSILGEHHKNGTLQFILRRKISNLISEGELCKTSIPGTRFGKSIFFVHPKKYHILVEAGRLGSEVYVFFDYKHEGKFHMIVDKYWILKSGMWEEMNEQKNFFEGKVLKFI